MGSSRTIGLLDSAWEDWNLLVRQLGTEVLDSLDAEAPSISWSLGHVTNHLGRTESFRLRVTSVYWLPEVTIPTPTKTMNAPTTM
jgi:hypothetical protein